MPSWLTWVLIGLTVIGLFFVWQGFSPPQDNMALVIEGQKITQAEFANLYDNLVAQYQRVYAQYGQDFGRLLQGLGGIERKLQLQSRLLDDLLRRRLIAQEIERRQIVVPKTDVDDQTEIEFERVLKQNNLTEEEAEEILKEQGRTLEGFKRELRQAIELNMQTERLRDAVAGAIEPTDQELLLYLEEHREEYDTPEQVHARHILIRVAENAPEAEVTQAKKQLEEIKKELESGADFAELAKQHSQDPGSAPNGGDLGFFGRGQMVQEFEDVAFSLEPGQVSDPVRTQFGFHLIKVEEKRPAEHPQLSQVRQQVRGDYIEAERKKRFEAWYKALKAQAKIVIADPLLRVFYLYEHHDRFDEALAEYAKLKDPYQQLHRARVLRKQLDALGENAASEQALALKEEILHVWLTLMTERSDPTERSYGVSQIVALKPNELPGQAFFQVTVGAGFINETISVMEKRLKGYGIRESVVLAVGDDQLAIWLRLGISEVKSLERLLSVPGRFELKRVLRQGSVGEELRATGLGEQALQDRSGRYYLLAEAPVIDKIEIKEIAAQANPAGRGPIVRLRLSEKTVRRLAQALTEADQVLALVIDSVVYGTIVIGAQMRELLLQEGSLFDVQFEDVLSASLEEAQALALVLQIGPLPANVRVSRP